MRIPDGEVEAKIEDFLRRNGSHTTEELATELGIDPEVVRQACTRLTRVGTIRVKETLPGATVWAYVSLKHP